MRTRDWLSAAPLFWLSIALLAGGAWSATIVVPTDYALLEDAVPAAAHGDTVVVLPGDHLVYYVLGWSNRDIVLRSLSGAQVTTITSTWEGRISLGPGVSPASVLEGFTIRDLPETAIGCWGGAPTLRDLRLVDCGVDADFSPYGALVTVNASPLLVNVDFVDNEARLGGGAHLSGGAPLLLNCRFTGNWAVEGGAVFVESGSPSFIACEFTGNTARTYFNWDDLSYHDGYGGAVYVGAGSPSFSHCRFAGNEARVGVDHDREACGGAAYLRGGSAPAFASCSFAGNRAGTLGGALFLDEMALPSLSACIVAFTSGGGGLASRGFAAADLACCDVFGNAGGDFVGLPDPTGEGGNFSANPLFCDLAALDLELAADSPCLPASNACGQLIGALGEGCALPTGVAETSQAGSLPSASHPNPFNPHTEIDFTLAAAAPVTLRIYSASGRLLRTLLDGEARSAGPQRVLWDGRDDVGQSLPGGAYLYRLQAAESTASGKLTLLR